MLAHFRLCTCGNTGRLAQHLAIGSMLKLHAQLSHVHNYRFMFTAFVAGHGQVRDARAAALAAQNEEALASGTLVR